jgi:4-amino-4-deoxy-L-arabinose transferase-like glycosyltransferase
MDKSQKFVWFFIIIVLLLGGALTVVYFSLPYPAAKGLADGLAQDGNFQSLTAVRFASLSLPLRLIGLVLLTGGVLLLIFRRKSQLILGQTTHFLSGMGKTLWLDLLRLLAALDPRKLEKTDGYLLAGLTLLAAGLRAAYILRPMSHDEAYTVVAFASRPIGIILTDYSLPNNHIFHSLLVHLAYLLFGIQPWAVRLPVVLAGMLLVPSGYLLARLLYDRHTALVTAGLLACAPYLISLSTDARGYILICLFTLLTLALGYYLMHQHSSAGWVLLAGLSALGFYTTPVMLYPFGMLLTWLLLSSLAGETRPVYGSAINFIKYVLAAGVAAAVLAAILYTPVFLTSGAQSVIANRFVVPLRLDDFIEILPQNIGLAWQSWNGELGITGFIFLAGFLLSLLFHWRIATHRMPVQLAALVWLAVELPLQRPYPWPKIWAFLFPLFILWGTAGLLALVKAIHLKPWKNVNLAAIATGAVLAVVASASLISAIYTYHVVNAPGEIENTTMFLKNQLQPGDIVVVADPDDAPLWYYFELHQVPPGYVIDIQKEPFQRAFVLVNPAYRQTLKSVINERGPSSKRLDMNSAKEVYRSGNTTVYLVSKK